MKTATNKLLSVVLIMATLGTLTIPFALKDIWIPMKGESSRDTQCLTAMLNEESCWLSTVPIRFNSSSEAVGIGGKSVTFTGGEVSGKATWTFSGYKVDPAYGFGPGSSSSGVGRVEVYNSSGYLLAHFELPLTSPFTVKNVNKIKVYAEALLPELSVPCGQRCIKRTTRIQAFVVASVYYKVEPNG